MLDSVLGTKDMIMKMSIRAVIIFRFGFLQGFTMQERYHLNMISNLLTNFQFPVQHVRSLDIITLS